jgi:WD40 repeat protein
MSLHFHKDMLVTCGADMAEAEWIRLWRITLSPFEVNFVENVGSNHERTVNVVRFSPSGRYIATGSDDSCVIISEKKMRPVFGEDSEEESWGSKRVLRGHVREVSDLCWGEGDKMIASAGMDGSVIVFNAETGKVL